MLQHKEKGFRKYLASNATKQILSKRATACWYSIRVPAIYFIIFLIATSSHPFFNSNSHNLLTPDQLKEDINALRKALEKHHAELYWYTSESEFTSIWDRLSTSTDTTLTDIEFFKLILPAVAQVKCAHTLFYPSQEIKSRGSRFPLILKFINSRLYIMSNHSINSDIPKGSELLSINGKNVNNLVTTILPNLQAQGGNIGWKYVILENDFQNYYYYLIEQVDHFDIEYIDPDTNEKVSKVIFGITDPTLKEHWSNWYPKTDGAPLKLKFYADPEVAIVTIKSLSAARYKQYDQDFDRTLKEYFDEIKKRGTRNLIIDIRGNEGGSYSTEKLYSYISQGNKSSANDHRHTKRIKPAKNAFVGEVIVLTNEKSISALEGFVSIFKFYNRGITIGGSTPGCYKGLCGGKKYHLVLPNSGFEVSIPTHKGVYKNSLRVYYIEGQGYPPDFKVVEKIEDLLKGKDSALEFALDMIKK